MHWLQRVSAILDRGGRQIVIAGGGPLGLPYVLNAMASERRLAWLEAEPRGMRDEISQGNSLADALNRATGSRIFPHGLPPPFHLRALVRHGAELLPLTIALTGSANAPQLVQELLKFRHHGVSVIIDFDLREQVPEGMKVLDVSQMRLSEFEALAIAEYGGLPAEDAIRALRVTDGRQPDFIAWRNERLGLPQEALPGPSPIARATDAATPVAPERVVAALVRQRRLIDALELSVMAAPDRVEDLLQRAGPEYQQRGQLGRLHLLLSSLDDEWQQGERTLEWQLVAAVAEGDQRDVLSKVDNHLSRHPAPDLRARRAALLSPERGRAEAQRALAIARTPLTLWQAGRMSTDYVTAITLLHESVRLAEESGEPYDIARNMGTLAEMYQLSGALQKAVHWGRLALSMLDDAEINDVMRRARILNNLVFASLLTGDTIGMRHRLEETARTIEGAGAEVAVVIRLTLSALELAEGRIDAAGTMLEGLPANLPRRLRSRIAHQRLLQNLYAGDTTTARQLAAEARALGAGEDPTISSVADLAEGMILALEGVEGALPQLLQLANSRELPLEDRLRAYLYSRLLPEAPRRPPADLATALGELAPAGLRALSGPESAFSTVWREILGEPRELGLQVLGTPRARLFDEEVRLTKRMWEMALLIALHPEGVSDEQLHDILVGDSEAFGINALRSHVSRVRSLIPISDNPYRLLVTYSLDVLDLREHLRAGDLRAALATARGTLLPSSDSPGIEDLRSQLDEELRQAILASTDADAAFELAERTGLDLELWEHAESLISASDARRAVARARIERIRHAWHD